MLYFRWFTIPSPLINMTKKELVFTIANETGATQLLVKEIVQKTFDTIIEALAETGRMELRDFGVFEVRHRAARIAHNPKTGQEVKVKAKEFVKFKPGKRMEDRVAERTKKKKRA